MRIRHKISQREALRLRKRVNQLLQERATQQSQWRDEYPGGVNVATIDISLKPETIKVLETAQKFSDVFIAKPDRGLVRLYAIPKSR